jgi:hypothetical protein
MVTRVNGSKCIDVSEPAPVRDTTSNISVSGWVRDTSSSLLPTSGSKGQEKRGNG